MKWLAVILILVVGCGEDRPRVIDPLLIPLVEEFEANVGFPVGSSVGFGSIAGEGVCYDGRVTISEVYREAVSLGLTDVVKPIVFHELGHCELGIIPHDDTMIDNCPASLMHMLVGTFTACYLENWDHYVALLIGS